jgi:uncharacterized membrane protein YhaH (DUF805 family)
MLGQFVGFEGRIGRGTWWLGQLIGLLILGAGMAAIGMAAHSGEDSTKPGLGLIGITGITYLICVVINVSVSVKRYHDRGKSGWWFFVVFIPLAGGIWQLLVSAVVTMHQINLVLLQAQLVVALTWKMRLPGLRAAVRCRNWTTITWRNMPARLLCNKLRPNPSSRNRALAVAVPHPYSASAKQKAGYLYPAFKVFLN